MTEEHWLTLDDCDDYRDRSGADVLCGEGLRDFFEVRAGRKHIILVLSTEQSPEAYRDRIRRSRASGFLLPVVETHFQGKYRHTDSYAKLKDLLIDFLDRSRAAYAYLSIELPCR